VELSVVQFGINPAPQLVHDPHRSSFGCTQWQGVISRVSLIACTDGHGRLVLPVFGSGFRQHAVIDKGCAGDVKKVPVSDQVAATR
jgi:hypothetical protein